MEAQNEMEEAQKFMRDDMAAMRMQAPAAPQAIEGAPAAEEAKVPETNVFKRTWNTVKDKTLAFKDAHPDLLKSLGKSIAIIVGLQASRWVIQQFI